MKKVINLTILLLLCIVLGFGCKGLTATEQASIQPVVLNYWTVYNNVAQLKKFADDYAVLRPYVKVNIKQVRYEEFDKLFLNALADDVPPDIISVNVRDLHKYASRLSAMPANVQMSTITVTGQYFKETVITPETVAMPTKRAVDTAYVSAVGKDVEIGSDIYGLPLAFDTLAIYYNKDLLDKAGIAEAPTTWEEFMNAVKKTTKFDTEGKIIQSGVALGTGNNIDNFFDILSLFALQSGAKMAEGNYAVFGSGLKPTNLMNYPFIKALNFYTDFARDNKEVYNWNEGMINALTNFTQGKSTFYFGFAYDYPTIKGRAPQMNLEVMPILQLNPSAPVNVANYWVESVAKKSKHQNEAWDFVRFITSPDNVLKYTKATRTPTPLRSQIDEQKKDIILAPFVSQVLNSENWYHGRDYTVAKKALFDMLSAYLKPYTPVENKSEAQYWVDLIQNTARRVQQTM